VDAFRRTTHRYPPKSWYSDIAQAVGDDDADLVFWHDVCTDENFGNLCSSVLIRVPFLLPVWGAASLYVYIGGSVSRRRRILAHLSRAWLLGRCGVI